MPNTPLRTVRLLHFPLQVWQRSADHHQELMREFTLMALRPDLSRDVPGRLRDLIDRVQERYGGFTEMPTAERTAAVAAGRDFTDLTYVVPESSRQFARELSELLDEADEFCRQGNLLTLAAPPESVAFRHWFFDEFCRQIDGLPPRPWPG